MEQRWGMVVRYREFLKVQNEFKCVVTRLFPFWCTCRNLDAVNFITSTRFQVPSSVPLPHYPPYGIQVALNTQSLCLLLVCPHCSHESYILPEGHPAPRRKKNDISGQLWLFHTFSPNSEGLVTSKGIKITFFFFKSGFEGKAAFLGYLQEHFLRFKVVITCENVWPSYELLINIAVSSIRAVHL